MKLFRLEPQDLLFFRDARPMTMGAGSGGHGARWPEPSLIFDALHAALHRMGDASTDPWHHHLSGRGSRRQDPANTNRTQRFGGLRTAGLFPCIQNGPGYQWLFPRPADVQEVKAGEKVCCLEPLRLSDNDVDLPSPLTHGLASTVEPVKNPESKIPPWWSKLAYETYLNNRQIPPLPPGEEKLSPVGLYRLDDLFAAEWTTGIGTSAETDTQDGLRIYAAEYLRLRPEVSLGFAATLFEKINGGSDLRERLGDLFTEDRHILVGGQQRVCAVQSMPEESRLCDLLPCGPKMASPWVKWVLLTPALFPHLEAQPEKGILVPHRGGWLPSWIDRKTGQVKLKLRRGELRRVWDETRRRTVRKATGGEEEIRARLVAARIPKPISIVGWSDRVHLLDTEFSKARGARETHLAVPAGATYYFEAEGETSDEKIQNARNLAEALNWHGADPPAAAIRNRRSTLYGEKGFGLGVCGTWKHF